MKCTICHKVIGPDEGRYALKDDIEADTSVHYDCQFPDGKDALTSAKDALAEMERNLEKLRHLGVYEDPVIDSTATTPKRRRR